MALRIFHSIVFLLAALPLAAAAEPSAIPKKFSASIGGFMGSSYKVELRDGVLIYTTSGGGFRNPKHATLRPSAAQWRTFRQSLDELKVWQWRASYPSKGTVDGTQWALEITYPDHAIKTSGDNNYPDAAGKPTATPEPAKAFARYLEAVEKLTGGKTFQ